MVIAGTDMAAAFVEHLTNPEVATKMAAYMELSRRSADEDEFAAYHGLI